MSKRTRLFLLTAAGVLVAVLATGLIAWAMGMPVLAALGSAQIGRLPDGRIVKRYLEDVPEKEVRYTTKACTRNYFKVLKGGKR